MIKPYVYWRLDTPLAYIVWFVLKHRERRRVGRSDCVSGFHERPAVSWPVGELRGSSHANSQNSPKKAVLLGRALSALFGSDKLQHARGDPSRGPGLDVFNAPYLAVALQQAIAIAGSGLTRYFRTTPISSST